MNGEIGQIIVIDTWAWLSRWLTTWIGCPACNRSVADVCRIPRI
jgi:hypothetical protein